MQWYNGASHDSQYKQYKKAIASGLFPKKSNKHIYDFIDMYERYKKPQWLQDIYAKMDKDPTLIFEELVSEHLENSRLKN